MTATYTFDIFSTLDGYGAHDGDWGGYWGKQDPELLEHAFAQLQGVVNEAKRGSTASIPDPQDHTMTQSGFVVVSSLCPHT